MADNGVVTAGGRLTDWVSLGVLALFVSRDAVDDAVAAAGKQARRSDGKLPPHVMVYFVMALALFADDDYEEVAARLTETLVAWGCWDDSWSVPTSGGITQARQRLGYEPVKKLFSEVAVPVAEEETAGAFLVPDRDGDGKGELIALITTITEMTAAPAALLAEAYHQRWEHEIGNAQLKTSLRGPGRVLRSKSPDMVRQELYGYLLTHYALSALICRAATEAGIDPDRVKFKRTVRIVRRRATDPAAFPLSSKNASSPRSWPTSLALSTSTPGGGTGPTPGWSSEPATTPTGSNGPVTTAPATPAPPRSAWSTCARSHPQHDQLTLAALPPAPRPGANPGTRARSSVMMYP